MAHFKAQLIEEVDKLKEEKKENENLVPGEDETQRDVEIIKEQIIDLNDKFDFLVSLLIKSQKIGMKKDELNQPDFVMGDGKTSINSNAEIEEEEIVDMVKTFEEKAKETTGKARKNLRKPDPVKPLKKRVEELKKEEEEKQKRQNTRGE